MYKIENATRVRCVCVCVIKTGELGPSVTTTFAGVFFYFFLFFFVYDAIGLGNLDFDEGVLARIDVYKRSAGQSPSYGQDSVCKPNRPALVGQMRSIHRGLGNRVCRVACI